MKQNKGLYLFTLVCLLFTLASQATYFGKNKIVYNKLKWFKAETEHFDIYWYEGMERYLDVLKLKCEEGYEYLSRQYDHQLTDRIPVVFYKNSDDFQQTHIISSFLPESVQGFAEPFLYRVVIPIDTAMDKLTEVIIHEINHIFEYNMYYRSIAMILSRMPLWFDEGLSVHMAYQWDAQRKMYLRDALYNQFIPAIDEFRDSFFYAYVYGPSIIEFIVNKYGIEGLRSLIFEASKDKRKDINKFLKRSLDIDLKELDRLWKIYLKNEFIPCLADRMEPYEISKRYGERKKFVSSFAPEPSPAGEMVAYLTTAPYELAIRVMDLKEDKDIMELTKGRSFKDYLYLSDIDSAISWSPSGETIAFTAKWEGRYRLFLYDVLAKEIVKRFDFPIHNMQTPLFGPEGKHLYFVGNEQGFSDIFAVDLATERVTNLTEDGFFDKDPTIAPDGSHILYSSFRADSFKLYSLDLKTKEKQLFLELPGNITQASAMKHDNAVLFVSDRMADINDLYIYDLETGELKRITNLTTGAYTPKAMYDENNELDKIIFAAYYRQKKNIYLIEAKDIKVFETLHPARETPAAALDLKQLEPELTEKDAEKLKLKFFVDAIDVTLAYRSDGIFVGQTILRFSDILGDNRFLGVYQQFGSYRNVKLLYQNFRRRLNYGMYFYYDNYLNYPPGSSGNFYVVDKIYGGEFFVSYPFNLYTRAEVALGYRHKEEPLYGYLGFGDVETESAYALVSLIRDTAVYNLWGPLKGYRANLSLYYAPSLGGDFKSTTTLTLDTRWYIPLSRRIVFAMRMAGGVSNGEQRHLFVIGGADTFLGNNTLRGYDISEFYGTRYGLINLEFRLPFIDLLAFAIGMNLPYIQSTLFLDMGVAWNDTDKLDLFENNRFKDIKSSYGCTFNVPLSGLYLNFTFAKKFDLRETLSDTIYQFSVGTRF